MVQTYRRKTERSGKVRPNVMTQALHHYNSTGEGMRKTATRIGILRSTLQGYIKTLQKLPEEDRSIANLPVGYSTHKQVFNASQEQKLVEYLKRTAEIYFGLSPRDVRVLAYECAKRFGINMPESWNITESGGADWFSGF